jgi:hypothetical protein
MNNNSLFNILGPKRINQGNDITNLLAQFNEFKSMYQGGDPKQQVQLLLRSGQMSQEQFKELANTADQLRAFFN